MPGILAVILVARGAEVLYLAPIPPSAKQFARLLATLQAQPEPAPGLREDAAALAQRLKADVFPRTLV